ncbi:restriction endonuclease subunit S [Streptococcus sp. A18]|uniref:restriction endonuclease subunit S n=1 Tax=Streptococcus sp. A18 TaxID=3373125 RepID=UPI00374D9F99
MSEWKKYKLSEIYTMSSGISSSKSQAGQGSPFLSFSTVFNNYFIPENLKDLMLTTKEEQARFSIIEGDVFLTRTSETLDELALSSVALNNYPFATYSGFLKRLRPKNKIKVYPKFIAFYLRSSYFRKTIINHTTMTLRASFNESMFSYLEVYLPDYDEQVRIGDFLYKLNQKITLNNQINEELEAMAKTLYDYWFVQFDFPDENGKPYKSSGGKMVYNDQLKREIPEGWGVDSLWNIATFYNGLAMQKFRPASETDESLPVIKIREMFSGFSKDTEKASTTIPKEAIIEAGDILFSWSATLEVILWGGEKGALNQHIFKVTSEKYPKSFIYNELRSYLKVFKTIAELRKTTMGHITQDHLKQAMIIVPPNDLIDEIHNRISLILKQQLDLKQQNQELSQLRDWLLPMLMNGLVKVD